jgi:hypothetical protein
MFQAQVNGRSYEIGEEIPRADGVVTLSATVTHCATAARARILRNGETVAEAAVSDGDASLSCHGTSTAVQTGWFRLDAVEPKRWLLAITNPIIVGAAH